MAADVVYTESEQTATVQHGAYEALAQRMLRAMSGYAEQNNVSLVGTHVFINDRPHTDTPIAIVVTVPKYIAQDHREMLEKLALHEAATHHPRPIVQFVYEQSAG